MVEEQPPRRTLGHIARASGLAILLVVAAILLRKTYLQPLESHFPWATFYPAVIVAAVYSGLYAGLLTMTLSCVAVLFLWSLFSSQPFISRTEDWLLLATFVIIGTIISGVAEATRRANARTRQAQARTEAASQAERLSAQAIAENERFIKTITDAMPGLVAYWDKDLRCRFANKPYLEWFGKPPEAIIGTRMQELLGERLFALNEPYIRGALKGEKQHFERTLTKADGSIGHTWANYIPDIDVHGTVAGFFVLVTDVTPLKAAEAELRLSASVYQNTSEGIIVTDSHGVILSVNPAFTAITGYTAEEAIGQTPRLLKSNRHDQAFYAVLWQELNSKGRWQGELWNRRKDGEVFVEWQTITKISDSAGEPGRYVAMFHDITDLWRKNESMRHLAFHDVLTDLPNRSLLIERIERQIAMVGREQRELAILFLDLDGFKSVNDRLGHHVGDDLLRMVAQKLQSLVRHADTVARLGGDEFVILLDNPANRDEVAQIAKRVVAVVNEPMELSGEATRVGVSIGIAMFPADGSAPAELIKNADSAMYIAKSAGKNTYRFFTP